MGKVFYLLSLSLMLSACSGQYASNGDVAREDSLHIDTVAILDEAVDFVITSDNVTDVLDSRLASGDVELLEKSLDDIKLQLTDIKQAGDKAQYIAYILKVQQYLINHQMELSELHPEEMPVVKEIMEMYHKPVPKPNDTIEPFVIEPLPNGEGGGLSF